jgi:hypothetical protein
MRTLTMEDANRFWSFFEKKHPDICKHLGHFSFIDNKILVFKPGKMKEEDFDVFQEEKENWLTENGFKAKSV